MGTEPPKVRAVFDCMVFLQAAARRESAAGACLLLVEMGAVVLCLSEEIRGEVRDVLTRPRVRRKFPALNDELVVVCRDFDILDLAAPSNPSEERLRRLAPQLRILDPVSFLAEARCGFRPVV